MSDLYSVIPGMQPTQQQVIEAELLAKQILEAKFPNIDLREGTGVRDLVLRPTATLLAMMKLATDYFFTQNTITAMDNSTPASMVDSVLSNFFVTRIPGTLSVINARLFFARAKNTSIPSTTFFSTDNISKFFPQSTMSILSSAMAFDTYSNEYYVDVNLVAEREGPAYDISSGSLLYFSNFDPYFLRAEINYLVTASTVTESNLNFISRAKNAISTRNLVNAPSIDFNLRSTFNYLTNILSVGMGDPEMLRDFVWAVQARTPAQQITHMTSSDGFVVATLVNHGFSYGQLVTLSGASSNTYNSTFTITAVTSSTFSFFLPIVEAVPVVLPMVRDSDAPVRMHMGGCTDIYCGTKSATGLTQLTTDNTGKALLTGPIYSAVRSAISGGTSPDSIPMLSTLTVPYTSIGVAALPGSSTQSQYVITAPGHMLKVGNAINVSGFSQAQSILGISCTGVTVTANVVAHGYLVGDNVVINGVLPAAYNGTYSVISVTSNSFTYNVPANITTSGNISGATSEVTNVNGTRIISSVTSNSITFVSANPNHSVSGTGTVTSSVPFSIYNSNIETVSISSVSAGSNGDLVVTIPKHGYQAGSNVVITGVLPIGYVGKFLVKSVVDQNNFTISAPSMVGYAGSVSSSNATCTSVSPSHDTGFSNSQSLVVDFGSAYPNQTVTFSVNYFQYLDSIQAYLDSPSNRIICGSYLARGYNLYMLDFNIVSYLTGGVNSGTVATSIATYLASLNPGDPFIVTEMVAILRANGVMDIKLPTTVGYTRLTRDLLYFQYPSTGTIQDVLDPNDRTSIFMINSISVNSDALPNVMIPTIR